MKVIMRHEARIRFREILAEGERRFGSRVASQLYEAYMHNMALLAENPYMGPLEPLLDRSPGVIVICAYISTIR